MRKHSDQFPILESQLVSMGDMGETERSSESVYVTEAVKRDSRCFYQCERPLRTNKSVPKD